MVAEEIKDIGYNEEEEVDLKAIMTAEEKIKLGLNSDLNDFLGNILVKNDLKSTNNIIKSNETDAEEEEEDVDSVKNIKVKKIGDMSKLKRISISDFTFAEETQI